MNFATLLALVLLVFFLALGIMYAVDPLHGRETNTVTTCDTGNWKQRHDCENGR